MLRSVNTPILAVPAWAERLLAIMDRKNHWAYQALAQGQLQKSQLLAHYQHEYQVYVRDFPVLLARVLGQVPPLLGVRQALAENIYEEQTGGLSKSAPHPELFLRMMEGLGFGRTLFDENALDLHPAAIRYRDFLLHESQSQPWQAAAALMTIFVEGSVNERAELAGTFRRKRGEEAIRSHPLVQHYGCPPSAMALSQAHAAVEGDHRKDAWRIVLDNTQDPSSRDAVVSIVERAFDLWWAYRDGVAEFLGLKREQVL
jgi:pyrroloquinoline-quinone synthase